MFLAVHIGFESFLAIWAHERPLFLVHSHVSSNTTGCGEDQTAFSTLKQSGAFMCPQVTVQAAPTDKLLATLKTHKRPFSCVRSCVLLQV